MDDPRRLLGARLRELRQAHGLTQEALAERVNLHSTYIGGIERGERNPSLMNIARLAAAFKLSLADVFSPLNRVSDPRTLRRDRQARKQS